MLILFFFCNFCAFSLVVCKLFYNFAKFQKAKENKTEILNNNLL